MTPNITVKVEDLSKRATALTGGAYTTIDTEIVLDKQLDDVEQVGMLFHEFLEAHFPCLAHKTIEAMSEDFEDCYYQWKEQRESKDE